MAPVAAKEEAKVEQPIGKQLKNADLYEISNEEKKEKRRSNEGRKLDLRNLAAEPLQQDAEPAFEVSPMAGSASLLQSVRKSANEGLSVIDEQSMISAVQSSEPSAAGRSPAGSAQGGELKRLAGIGSDGRVDPSGADGVASLGRNRPPQGAHQRRASAARPD